MVSTDSWGSIFPNAWLLYTLEGKADRTDNVGNLGYEDRVDEVYRYDSLVPNSNNLAVGDIIVLRSPKSLLGIARIEKIDKKQGKKHLNRCPNCRRTNIKERKEKRPRYRCGKQHCKEEFDEPVVDFREVTKYSAWYKDNIFYCPDAIPIAQLRKACVSEKSQLSIRKMDIEKLVSLLMQISETTPKPVSSALPSTRKVKLTDEMIPLSSMYPDVFQKPDNMIKVEVDGNKAHCFINDQRMGSPKIVIMFDRSHERWHDYFTTKHFKFEEPGLMAWGHDGESMEIFQIFALPNEGKPAHSQSGYFSLTISATQLSKSTINANKSIRDALLENQLVDYNTIEPGSKIRKPCRLIFGGRVVETKASFLIPTRRGDTSPEPRFWPYTLNRYAEPETTLHFLATATRLIVSDSPETLDS